MFAKKIINRSAKGIALAIVELIKDGRLNPGDKLPTLRSLASDLQVSVPTVANAWENLREMGVIETRRRGGTVVMPFRDVPLISLTSKARTQQRRELGLGNSDLRLLPPLDDAFNAALRMPNLHTPAKDHVLPELISAVATSLPYTPQAWFLANNGTEAAILAIEAASKRGGIVAIEQPSSPRLLDIMQTLGLQPIPIECDDEGPSPEALRQALRKGISAFVFQPRAHIPLGHSVSEKRIKELAQALKNHPNTFVVEDDSVGPLSSSAYRSIGAFLPSRVISVKGYCRAFGLDLRTSVLAGPSAMIQAIQKLRSHGTAFNSRILQAALTYQLTSTKVHEEIRKARRSFEERRKILSHFLSDNGVEVANRDGLVLWLKVPNERATMLRLAEYGLNVGSGRVCFITPPEQSYIRIAAPLLPYQKDQIEMIGKIILDCLCVEERMEYD